MYFEFWCDSENEVVVFFGYDRGDDGQGYVYDYAVDDDNNNNNNNNSNNNNNNRLLFMRVNVMTWIACCRLLALFFISLTRCQIPNYFYLVFRVKYFVL